MIKKIFTHIFVISWIGCGLAPLVLANSAPQVHGVCAACRKDPCVCPDSSPSSTWEDRKAFLQERQQWLQEQKAAAAYNAARAERDKQDIAREKERERSWNNLFRDIIQVKENISKVNVRAKSVGLLSGTAFFGIGAGALPVKDLRQPTGYTPGTKITAENLRRCLSIIQHMANIPANELGIEDERFLMEQAGFALQPGVALELEVKPALLKKEISAKDAQEFERLINETTRLTQLAGAYQSEQEQMFSGLEAMEKQTQEALRDNDPGDNDLKRKYDEQFNAYLESARNEQKAIQMLQDNRLSTRKFAQSFVVGYDLPEAK